MRIPPGFNTVSPYFFVNDTEGFVAFLIDRLGGVRDRWGNLWWISQRLIDGRYTP